MFSTKVDYRDREGFSSKRSILQSESDAMDITKCVGIIHSVWVHFFIVGSLPTARATNRVQQWDYGLYLGRRGSSRLPVPVCVCLITVHSGRP
jgi:hypothetical protein